MPDTGTRGCDFQGRIITLTSASWRASQWTHLPRGASFVLVFGSSTGFDSKGKSPVESPVLSLALVSEGSEIINSHHKPNGINTRDAAGAWLSASPSDRIWRPSRVYEGYAPQGSHGKLMENTSQGTRQERQSHHEGTKVIHFFNSVPSTLTR